MNLPSTPPPTGAACRRLSKAFTLVELMVSVTVLSLLLLLVFQMLDETQKTWSRAKGMVASFKDARNGFEAMNRNVSQATLNTYLGYDVATNNAAVPKSFQRRSELHFVCGPAKTLLGDADTDGRKRLTHCLFFQAPLGYQTFDTHTTTTTHKDTYGEMDNLLNGWGYYVEYASDKTERPQFLATMTPPVAERFRFRLMEFRQPAEATTIYQYHLEGQTTAATKDKVWEWFRGKRFGVGDPVNNDPIGGMGSIRTTRVLADNIIALIISPRLAENDTLSSADTSSSFSFRRATDIAPEYVYDSRRFQYDSKGTGDLITYSRHQVPPVLRVTIVAIDEVDAVRYAAQNNAKDTPKYAPDDKFFQKVENYGNDMKFLSESLNAVNIRHRVFTSNIRMREGNFQKIR